ncbi:MAG: branched-chain amino acid ABC transporter permease [Bacillota bacterium]|nr:branched-chain amino acid ABC transporter permease [Bacillota bacterium]
MGAIKDRLNKKNIITAFILAAVYLILFYMIKEKIINSYKTQILIIVGINIILACSLNLILGFTGQLTLGHAGFMSIGGYTAAMMTLKFHLPFPLALIAGGAFAAFVSYLFGLPILRLKGDYLAISTLGFGEIVRVIIVNLDFLGGPRGLAGIPKKTTFTWVYIITVLTVIIIYNLIKSTYGRGMISVREDEIASEAMGINTTKYKLMAFVLGGFFAGVAGGLYGHLIMFLDPKTFNFLKSMDILIYVVFGGMGSISGSILSASILTYLPEVLRSFSDLRLIIYSMLIIILMLFRPEGLMGSKELSLKTFRGLSEVKPLKRGGKS